jgi:hypothetical protein
LSRFGRCDQTCDFDDVGTGTAVLDSNFEDVNTGSIRSLNKYAVTSLVLGIIWIYWVGSVFAIVFGIIARRQIAREGGRGVIQANVGIVLGCLWLISVPIVYFAGAAHHS